MKFTYGGSVHADLGVHMHNASQVGHFAMAAWFGPTRTVRRDRRPKGGRMISVSDQRSGQARVHISLCLVH
jgi:hypothetical protein